jgi:small subunit ribosomal protein S20
MPNTKSAERRMRNSARRSVHNSAMKSRLSTLERKLNATLGAGQKEAATANYRALVSALDKAAKTGVIHKSKANRKKSRLALALAK